MDWLREIKIMIFDLDGTLYQDYTFLGRYLRYMLNEQLTEQELQQQINEAYEILEGNHPVRFGYYYNHKNKKVYTHENLKPISSFFWDKQDLVEVEETAEHLFYIGDPWCIAAVFGDRHNISEEKRRNSFELVRKEMLREPHNIHRHSSLFDVLANLDMDRKIFMTNTPGPSGPEFVKYLKLEHLFDEYIYDAGKPGGIQVILERLLSEGYQPHEIISVGDNPFNDLYPVKHVGGKTCLISQYKHADSTMWDESVKTIEELAKFLQRFQTVQMKL